MSEYTVSYTQIPAARSDGETYGGLLLYIRPPVQLNPDAVERYLTTSAFEPVDRLWKNLDIKDVVVLGSTPEQTTIYASLDRKSDENVLAEQAANDTVKLLQFMGATAMIDNSPTPDA